MNLLKELEPFQADIERFLPPRSMGMTEKNTRLALIDIWHRFENLPETKAVRYPNVRSNSVMPPVDNTCNECFATMIGNLKHWQDRLNSEAMVYFKGVPDGSKAKVTEIVIPKSKVIEVVAKKDDGVYYINDIESVKNALTKSKIKFHHRMKLPKLLELLNGKS